MSVPTHATSCKLRVDDAAGAHKYTGSRRQQEDGLDALRQRKPCVEVGRCRHECALGPMMSDGASTESTDTLRARLEALAVE